MSVTWNKNIDGATTTSSVSTTITTTGDATVWTPTSGFRFVLVGWAITMVVNTVLAAGNAVTIFFVDATVGNGVGPGLAGFSATAAEGTQVTTSCDMGSTGWRSGAVDRPLRIHSQASLSTGVLRIAGIVWGHEVK